MNRLTAVILGCAALGVSGLVNAIPCDVDGTVNGTGSDAFVTGNQSGDSYACLNGSGTNESAAAMDGFFNVNDWVEIGKAEEGTVTGGIGLIVSPTPDGTPKSGTWQFSSNIWDSYNNISIVLKDGNVDGTYWTAYDVTSGDWSGNWDVGVLSGGLSHFSVYGTAIPAPLTLGLMGIGLVGVGVARKYRKQV